jgi:citrate synthase
VAAVEPVLLGLPTDVAPLERLMVAVAAGSTVLRAQGAATPQSLLTTLVWAAAWSPDRRLRPGPDAGPVPAAHTLWRGLSSLAVTPDRTRALNQVLVALAEHELATSTLAVRIAASVRTDLVGCVLAGLAALDGAAHSGVSVQLHRTLLQPDGIDRVIAMLADFGHPIHVEGDPRTDWLFAAATAVARRRERTAVDRLLTAMTRGRGPNVDVGLAVFTLAARMPVGASKLLFAVARSAGWLAHAQEEFAERPVRFRGRAVPRGALPRT